MPLFSVESANLMKSSSKRDTCFGWFWKKRYSRRVCMYLHVMSRLCTHMPELPPPDMFDSITYAKSTDEEKREIHAPLGTISMAAVTGDVSRPSAQRRNRSASAAYTALPCSTARALGIRHSNSSPGYFLNPVRMPEPRSGFWMVKQFLC